MKKKILTLLVAMMFLVSCAPAEPEATPMPATPTSNSMDTTALWMELREEQFGLGIAIPCWWKVEPMKEKGDASSMLLRNFDDAFFAEHSTGGDWVGGIAPNETIAMNITVSTELDAGLAITEAFSTIMDSSRFVISNTQDKKLGHTNYTIITLGNNTGDNRPGSIVFATMPEPGTLVIFNTTPVAAILSNDAQAILISFAGSPDEAILIPEIAPAPPLIDGSCPL